MLNVVATVRLGSMLETPDTIAAVSIENSGARTVQVDVASIPPGGTTPDGWLPLGHSLRDTTATFHQVIDQGDRWRFRFSHQGQEAVVDVSRAELEASGFTVAVPDSLDRALAAAGVPVAP